MLQLSPISQMNSLDNEMATESQATPQICGLKRKHVEKIRKSYSMYRRLKMRARKKKQFTDFVCEVKKKSKENEDAGATDEVKSILEKINDEVVDLETMPTPGKNKRDVFFVPTGDDYKVLKYVSKVDQQKMETIYILDRE